VAVVVVGFRREPQPPMCYRMTELFFGPDVDGRTDKEREAREALAKHYCGTCPYRLRCIERTALHEYKHAANGVFGVAGGMAEGERKAFYRHLAAEGYDEVPEGQDLIACLRSFMRPRLATTEEAV
jgi:hypothetical protein